MNKNSPEFKLAMGEMTTPEYLEARGVKATQVDMGELTGTRAKRKRTHEALGSDLAHVATFAEFLKHAGPPPKPVQITPLGESE